jgi:hypothetical protein
MVRGLVAREEELETYSTAISCALPAIEGVRESYLHRRRYPEDMHDEQRFYRAIMCSSEAIAAVVVQGGRWWWCCWMKGGKQLERGELSGKQSLTLAHE